MEAPGRVGCGPWRASLGAVFTGLVREVGEVVALEDDGGGIRVAVAAPRTAGAAAIGDSVAINGVCLTVVDAAGDVVTFHAMPETLARSSFAALRAGTRVNVEPALRGADRLGGHFVQGHVDAVGTVRSVAVEGAGARIWIDAPPEVLRYVVEKGSIAVEGTSLTVAELDESGFAVALIPHTLTETTLGELAAGDAVNLEVDVLAKYVERLVAR